MPQKSIKEEDSRESGAAIPTLESSDTTGTGKHKIQVVGAHRIWGNCERQYCQICQEYDFLYIQDWWRAACTRKTKDNPVTNRTKWWFVIHADEHLPSDLDAKWEQVKLQTPWKLEPCFKHENTLTEAEIPPADTRADETGTDSVPLPAYLETAQNISLITTSSDTTDSQQQPVPGSDWFGQNSVCTHHQLYILVSKPWVHFTTKAYYLSLISSTVNTLKPHIICIVESWLSSEINYCEILIPGFQLYRFDRHCHGGGVLMYVSDEFLVSVLYPPSLLLEILTLSVLSVNNFKLHLCLFYCPPSSTWAT